MTALISFVFIWILIGSGNEATAEDIANKDNRGSRLVPEHSIEEFQGRIFFLENEMFFHQVCEKIDSAEKSIYVGAYLFKTSKSRYNRAVLLLEKLVAARNRSVAVKVVLEKSDYNERLNLFNQHTKRKLAKHGINVRFDSVHIQSHAKLIVIDGRWTFLGSHNLSHSALKYNNEVSVLIDSREIAGHALLYLKRIK